MSRSAQMAGAVHAVARLYQWPGLLLALTAIFWSGNSVAGRLAVGQVSPLLLVFLRWVLVLAVMWPLYGRQVREHWPQIRPQLLRIVLMAMLGLTGFNALYYVAAHTTTAVNIGILQGSVPVIVLVAAFLTHGTRATLVQIAGVLVTALGVIVVATQGMPLEILHIDLNRGDLIILIACVLYALYTVALRDRPRMSGAAFFTLLALISAITSVPLVLAEAYVSGLSLPTWQGWLVILYVAIFPSCLAQILFLRGVDLIGPGRAGVFVNLVPVFSAILAVALISEPFAPFHAVALALVIGGIWLAERGRAAPGAKG
ncbi:MAG TPA: DMT family transporter [Hyphomicrobiaceae bacterium]|nr:DMT family transporter [Hyphomicrobiaceae bacterium]